MAFHIVAPRPLDRNDTPLLPPREPHPRHALAMLAEALDATVHAPAESDTPGALDRLRGRLAGPARHWAFARRVARTVDAADVVFCSSEEAGFQVAAVCGALARPPRVCVFVHNLDRPRGRLGLRLFGLGRRVDLWLACSTVQVAFLRRFLRLADARARFVWDHTDTSFFCPGPPSDAAARAGARPALVSVGLENRDYRTLATATGSMPVDVRVSGFSADAAVLAKTFPSALPDNMSRRFYPWTELVQLYRDAAAVVVSVHPNRYAAGVQSLMEGMACGRPVIASATEGLASYLDDSVVTRVPPGDPEALRQAIERLLADPAEAARRGLRARTLAAERHAIERYVGEIAGLLRELAAPA